MYYQPQKHSNISICGISDVACIKRVDQEIISKQNASFDCGHCLNGCFAINYDGLSTFSTSRLSTKLPILQNATIKQENFAIVHAYFGGSAFRSEKRDEFIGFSDFLSSIGGLLGLFLGFSVISLVEIFYFISIRPYCDHLRFSKNCRELLENMQRKMMGLPRKKNISPMEIKMVETNLNYNTDFHHQYID